MNHHKIKSSDDHLSNRKQYRKATFFGSDEGMIGDEKKGAKKL